MDPLVPNQVRYRTAPHSEDNIIRRAGRGVKVGFCAGLGICAPAAYQGFWASGGAWRKADFVLFRPTHPRRSCPESGKLGLGSIGRIVPGPAFSP